MNKKIFIILLLTNAAWAGTYAATKSLMGHAPYYLITSIRYIIAAIPLLLIAYHRTGLRMNAMDVFKCGLMGIATFTLSPVLMYAGVGLSRSSDAAIITAMEPLLVSLGAYIYLREKIGRKTAFALLIAFGGAMTLSEFWNTNGMINPLGTFLILFGVFFESLYSVIGKQVLARHPALKVSAVTIALGSAFNMVTITALGLWPQAKGLTLSDWLVLVLYLSLLCTALGYTIWFVALKNTSTANVTITIFTQPALGILISWIWVNETPTATTIIGALIIFIAVASVIIGNNSKPTKHLQNQPL